MEYIRTQMHLHYMPVRWLEGESLCHVLVHPEAIDGADPWIYVLREPCSHIWTSLRYAWDFVSYCKGFDIFVRLIHKNYRIIIYFGCDLLYLSKVLYAQLITFYIYTNFLIRLIVKRCKKKNQNPYFIPYREYLA